MLRSVLEFVFATALAVLFAAGTDAKPPAPTFLWGYLEPVSAGDANAIDVPVHVQLSFLRVSLDGTLLLPVGSVSLKPFVSHVSDLEDYDKFEISVLKNKQDGKARLMMSAFVRGATETQSRTFFNIFVFDETVRKIAKEEDVCDDGELDLTTLRFVPEEDRIYFRDEVCRFAVDNVSQALADDASGATWTQLGIHAYPFGGDFVPVSRAFNFSDPKDEFYLIHALYPSSCDRNCTSEYPLNRPLQLWHNGTTIALEHQFVGGRLFVSGDYVVVVENGQLFQPSTSYFYRRVSKSDGRFSVELIGSRKLPWAAFVALESEVTELHLPTEIVPEAKFEEDFKTVRSATKRPSVRRRPSALRPESPPALPQSSFTTENLFVVVFLVACVIAVGIVRFLTLEPSDEASVKRVVTPIGGNSLFTHYYVSRV